MGLTIHYTIGFKGNAEELNTKLSAIRQKCLDLPFEEVNEIEHIKYSKADYQLYKETEQRTFYPNNTPENMENAQKLYQARGINRDALIEYEVYHRPGRISPIEMMNWSVWAGNGCEGTDLNFFKKKTWWRASSFTKTQYAEQFVKCHLLVIQILDLFKEAGFTVKVKDEGKYWKTRDMSVLAIEINGYTDLLKTAFGSLSEQAVQAVMIVDAPITECQNYMTVKDKKEVSQRSYFHFLSVVTTTYQESDNV